MYLEGVKKGIRLCGNIKIDNNDFRDLVVLILIFVLIYFLKYYSYSN
jgi:hypothetical protein